MKENFYNKNKIQNTKLKNKLFNYHLILLSFLLFFI